MSPLRRRFGHGDGGSHRAVLTGTVRQLIVEDRTTGKTTTYQTLRLDDGTAVELIGTPTASLQIGARAQVTGSKTGGKLAVSQFEPLAAPQPMQVAAAPSQVQGTLTLAHSDDFAGGHGKFGYVVRPVDGGRATPLVLDLMPDTLRNGMQVIATGSVTADAVSLDATSITIIAPPAPKPSTMTSAGPLALTTNNLLVILVKFSDSPVTDPFTQAQVDAVVRTNANSVASYYNEVSYNKEQLNVTVTPWLQTGVATPAGCDYTTIGNRADTAATAAGYTGTYQNRFYVFPRESACGWAGLAYVSFGEAWSNGYNQLSVYAHELGHNFGLLHAGSLNCGSATLPFPATGCSASEYGDPFVVMGNQSAGHFDALQKTLIDAPSGPWIAATAIKTHTSGTATYILGPIESAGVSTYAVKIPTAASNRTYWIEYRQPVGLFDSFISAANSGLHVRIASPFEVSSGSDDTEILDMTPASASPFTNAALLPGMAYVDAQVRRHDKRALRFARCVRDDDGAGHSRRRHVDHDSDRELSESVDVRRKCHVHRDHHRQRADRDGRLHEQRRLDFRVHSAGGQLRQGDLRDVGAHRRQPQHCRHLRRRRRTIPDRRAQR